MKVLEKINLIEKIGRHLQSQMTYRDIDTYLTAYGIKCKDVTPSVNSKYVYVKEILSEVSEEKILNIADELNIKHENNSPIKGDPTFWKTSIFAYL